MNSKASVRLWNTPDLKIHIAKALDMQRDLLHLAETNKATCALLLPLLYENICVAIDHISQIEEIFRKYPEYARQCKRLRVESPDKIERSYLEGKMWRDKGVVVNFRPDPSRRYDAGFSPDWEDDAHYVASVTENSDPIDWLVYEDEDATNALDMLLGEANAPVSDEENEDSADELDFHDAWVDEDGHDDNDSEIFGSQDSASIQGMDTRPHEASSSSDDDDTTRRRPMTVLQYWQNLVEKRKDDTSPVWLKKKQIMDGHIQKRLYRSEREIEGSIRFQKACDALVLVLTQLSASSRLTSFEWIWEASQGAIWPVTGASRVLWAAVEKNSPSLQKLVLKFFWRDRETWKTFTSTRYQSLRILHLNMANARYCKMRPLVAMLKALPELEAMHLKLHDQTYVRPDTLPITQPKLRYFYWEGGGEYLRSAAVGSSQLFRRNPHIDTLHISCTSRSLFKIEDNSVLPRLRAVSYNCHLRPDLIPLGDIVSRRPVVIVRSRLSDAGLLAFLRLPVAASATVQWLDVRYYSNFRLDLATYREALRTVPRLKELTIRTRSERFDGRLTPLDLSDVLNAIPHDHPLTALTLYDPDGDALNTSDFGNLPPISPALKYLGWETNEGRVLYALEKRGDKTVANEISYPRKQSWVWTQNSILDHDSEGELWTDPFDGEVIPGLSQL